MPFLSRREHSRILVIAYGQLPVDVEDDMGILDFDFDVLFCFLFSFLLFPIVCVSRLSTSLSSFFPPFPRPRKPRPAFVFSLAQQSHT